jgi:hypothetical protein
MAPRWLRVFRLAWWALVGWSARSPVAYGLSRCGGRRPRTRGSGSGPGENYSGRSRRWRCPWEASVAPPPSLFSPVEPAPLVSAEFCEHSQRPHGSSPLATRQRVVLLPHTQIEPPETRATIAAPEGPQA